MREHIDRTMGNFDDLMAEDPDFDIIPTVQGWRPADYEACLELYNKHGVNLTSYPLVGVGSVCRHRRSSAVRGTRIMVG
ncbi:deazapurine DNA modification protein DpdA family protein [Streptomyces mirabilis]|uniref:deazapurine DNA modification protein DpdA family protein n=1 Tax=Streptomyces mirabilis TaxID=68239 RepID=UPI0036A25811